MGVACVLLAAQHRIQDEVDAPIAWSAPPRPC